jgi:hypothetical protein
MPLDTSIYSQIQQPQIESPLNAMAKASQFRNIQNQQELQAMQLQDATEARAGRNALASAYKSAVDPLTGQVDRTKLLTGVASSGQGAQIPGLQKSFGEQDKATREAEEKDFDLKKKKLGIVGSVFGKVAQNPTLQAANDALDYLSTTGIYKPEQIETWRANANNNPASIKTFAEQAFNSAIDADKQLTASITQRGQDMTDNRIRSEGAANRGVTLRGQNMADSRSRDANQISRDNKPLTEGQAKSAAFGSRMQSADEVINSLDKAGKQFSTPGSRAGFGIGAAVNVLNSSEGQQLDQAKRDFINATLRRESGAVISDSEFANAEKQYFPQVGDSPEVIKQKAKNRQISTRGVLADVPEARREGLVKEIRGPSSTSNIDALLDKYK